MSKEAFNEDWCRHVAQSSIDNIETSMRMIDFCLERKPEVVKDILTKISPEHPLYEVFRKYG